MAKAYGIDAKSVGFILARFDTVLGRYKGMDLGQRLGRKRRRIE
jgi:hypothetical protein